MNQPTLPTPKKERKLLDQHCDALRVKHDSPRTEETYAQRVKILVCIRTNVIPNKRALEIGGGSAFCSRNETNKRMSVTRPRGDLVRSSEMNVENDLR